METAWEAQRAARRVVLDRQMSTEAEAPARLSRAESTESSQGGPPPASPPPVAELTSGFFLPAPGTGGGTAAPAQVHPQRQLAAPTMIPTRSLLRTDSMDFWGETSTDDIKPSVRTRSTEDAEAAPWNTNASIASRRRSFLHSVGHEQQDAVGLWDKMYDKARPMARRTVTAVSGHRVPEVPTSSPPKVQWPLPEQAIAGQQQKKKRRVAKDRPKPKPWSDAELHQFRTLLQHEGANCWAAKAVKLGTGRSAKSLHTRWLRDEGRIIDRPRTVAAAAAAASMMTEEVA